MWCSQKRRCQMGCSRLPCRRPGFSPAYLPDFTVGKLVDGGLKPALRNPMVNRALMAPMRVE